jgi:hypothetical protein
METSLDFGINLTISIIKSTNQPSINLLESLGWEFIKEMKWGETIIEYVYYYTTLPIEDVKGIQIPVKSVKGYNLTTFIL